MIGKTMGVADDACTRSPRRARSPLQAGGHMRARMGRTTSIPVSKKFVSRLSYAFDLGAVALK